MKFLNKIDGAAKVIQDAENRFVSDVEKQTWNGKADGNHNHSKNDINDFPTSLPASGGSADTAKHLVGDDTRSVNSSPSVYMNGGSRYVNRAGWQTEFKNVSTIGLTGLLNGTYCYLQTHTPWSDPSGGYPIQVAYGNGTPCWRVGVSTSVWSAWQKVSDGGNANTINGFTVGVNVPSNAKFTDTVYSHPATHPSSMITGLPSKLSEFTKDINFNELYYTESEMDTLLGGKVDNSRVLTDVPANAKFTDTIYTHPSTHPASMITESTTKRFVSDAEKTLWNSKSEFSGNYNDLSNKPIIPSTTSQLTNNSGYITINDIPDVPPSIQVGTVKPTDGSMWYQEI